MRLVLTLLFVPSAIVAQAQAQYFDVNSNNSMVRFFDPVRKNDNTEISGSCFWKDDWMPAKLLLKDGRKTKIKEVKLNYYANEARFLARDGMELIVKNTILKSLTFLDKNDTSKVAAHFEIMSLDFKTQDSFYQVLGQGKTQLLKHTRIVLHKSDYDPLRGKTDMSYDSEIDYFLKHEDNFSKLKGLNKSAILSVLKPRPEIDQWLAKNKNKLKNETDVAEFLTFYDTLN